MSLFQHTIFKKQILASFEKIRKAYKAYSVEWEAYFYEYKEECRKFENQIHVTDKDIDRMLYGLAEKEMKIIES